LRPNWRHAESPRSSSITRCARAPRSISIADSALAAIEWVSQHVADYGGDPTWISLLGHSAGAHLCAVGLAADWRARDIDPSFIRGAVLVSGIFDPAPAMHTTVNADLHLTPEIVARHDVERRALSVDCPVSVLAGGLEPWMWIDQSFRYSHHLRRQGRDPRCSCSRATRISTSSINTSTPKARCSGLCCAWRPAKQSWRSTRPYR
jgi:acetyl esterase/lipase